MEGRAFYIPQLDALRFLAFLTVFAVHALPVEPATYPIAGKLIVLCIMSGRFGVDLFFVISSYLITSLLLREVKTTGRLAVSAFYARRALRIWPLFFGFVLLAPLLSYVLPLPRLEWYYTAGFLAFVGNWVIAVMGASAHTFTPLWSLCVEEQFYLAWPWLMKAANRRTVIVLSAVMIGVSICARAACAALDVSQDAVWMMTITRFDAIAVGAILATIQLPRVNWLMVMALGFGGFVAAEWLRELGPWMTVPSFTVAAAAGGLILTGAFSAPRPPAFLIYLGRISFGLYIFHILMIELSILYLPRATITDQLVRVAAALIATIAAAALSYHFYEMPFLKLKKRFEVIKSRPDEVAAS